MSQLIVAHRGASFDAPENTMAAFRLAWEKGADAIEGDFYLTTDGEIVCIHDKTTKRVSPETPAMTIAESTLSELRTLDVGSWKSADFFDQRIPTLSEVLESVPGDKGVFVEIKCGVEILPTLKTQLADSTLSDDQITLIAFDRDVVKRARKMMPQYRVNWLTSFKQDPQTGSWSPNDQSVLDTLSETSATGLGANGNLNVVDAELSDAILAAGRGLHVWTINDPGQARKFAELGVGSITTDRPAIIRNAIESITESESQRAN